MKTFTFTLNVQVDARDKEEALAIAGACKTALEVQTAFKLEVDIDDVEEL